MNDESNISDSRIIHATDDSFDAEVIQSEQPTLVDFWAPWCGPCKAIAPILEQLAADKPSLRVVKINVDEHPQTAQKYNVRAIPTLLMFVDGKMTDTKIGAVAKADLTAFVDDAIDAASSSSATA
ncbi:MAG: thioredoxin [Gammaproteobacteria bacterium WSBS_2016_MAG_OTU1]